jgi:hypothetical protein
MRRLILAALLIFITGHSIYGTIPNTDPESFCKGYLEAVHDLDWDKAREFWMPSELEKSSRFGICYRDISAKYDCASTLITNADKVAAGQIEVSLININQSGDNAEFDIQLVYRGDTTSIKYFAQKDDGKWYFVSAMHAYAGDWKVYPTRYANVYCNDASKVNDYALNALDDFISATGKFLGIDSDKMALLEKEKLDYYLCTENEFERLTGYNAHGITNLPFDAIITRHLPHPHEITHFMINYALQDLPLYTLPIMQEGLAVSVGGRWGKSPAVLDELGSVLLKNQFCSLDELLTFDNFNIDMGMPDISYPVSGLFVKYLVNKLGMIKFKQLYLELSGSIDEVRSWDREHVISAFEKQLGLNWKSIQEDFAEFRQQFENGSIVPIEAMPSSEPIAVLEKNGCGVRIYDDADEYIFEIKSMPDSVTGTIFISDSEAPVPSLYQSGLFYEQFDKGAYGGQMFALRFSPEEAGLYNYYTDILEAKFIRSFYPQSPYWNPESHIIKFRMNKELLPRQLNMYDLKLAF